MEQKMGTIICKKILKNTHFLIKLQIYGIKWSPSWEYSQKHIFLEYWRLYWCAPRTIARNKYKVRNAMKIMKQFCLSICSGLSCYGRPTETVLHGEFLKIYIYWLFLQIFWNYVSVFEIAAREIVPKRRIGSFSSNIRRSFSFHGEAFLNYGYRN